MKITIEKSKELELIPIIQEIEKDIEGHKDPEPWPSQIFEANLDNPYFENYIVRLDNKPIGFLMGNYDPLQDIHYLIWIVVRKGYQNQGIGTKLYAEYEKGKENSKIFLFAYEHLVEHYARLGFKELNRVVEMFKDNSSNK